MEAELLTVLATYAGSGITGLIVLYLSFLAFKNSSAVAKGMGAFFKRSFGMSNGYATAAELKVVRESVKEDLQVVRDDVKELSNEVHALTEKVAEDRKENAAEHAAFVTTIENLQKWMDGQPARNAELVDSVTDKVKAALFDQAKK